MRSASACWRHGANSSGSARLTAMTSGLSMCSDGGEIWPSAVMRASFEPPIAPITIGVSPRADALPVDRGRGLRLAFERGAGRRGIVTNTLPSPWPSETHMSGAYSTERISTLKYSGSSAAATAPAKAAVRRVDRAREDDRVRAERGLERRGDVQRLRCCGRRARARK